MEEKNTSVSLIDNAKKKFELACKDAQTMQLAENFGGAFVAAGVVGMLREAMTTEVMQKVFMPLMNTKVGFLTDRTGKPDKQGKTQPIYTEDVVRDCIIEAVAIGLLPTGNQMNILAGRMYPTKEGYTALLKKLGCKYLITVGVPRISDKFAEVDCKINYEYNGEKNSFSIVANTKCDAFSSMDQLKGKAERRAKKMLYEYLTGIDLGEGDETSTQVEDVDYTEIKVNEEIAEKANQKELTIEKPIGPQSQPAWMKD